MKKSSLYPRLDPDFEDEYSFDIEKKQKEIIDRILRARESITGQNLSQLKMPAKRYRVEHHDELRKKREVEASEQILESSRVIENSIANYSEANTQVTVQSSEKKQVGFQFELGVKRTHTEPEKTPQIFFEVKDNKLLDKQEESINKPTGLFNIGVTQNKNQDFGKPSLNETLFKNSFPIATPTQEFTLGSKPSAPATNSLFPFIPSTISEPEKPSLLQGFGKNDASVFPQASLVSPFNKSNELAVGSKLTVQGSFFTAPSNSFQGISSGYANAPETSLFPQPGMNNFSNSSNISANPTLAKPVESLSSLSKQNDVFKSVSTPTVSLRNSSKITESSSNLLISSKTPENVFKPVEPAKSLFKPVEPATNLLKPADTQSSLFKPAQTQSSLFKPADTQSSLFKPADTQPNLFKPADTQSNLLKPADTQSSLFKPADTQSNLFKPAETQSKQVEVTSSLFKQADTPSSFPKPTETSPNPLKPFEPSYTPSKPVETSSNPSNSAGSPAKPSLFNSTPSSKPFSSPLPSSFSQSLKQASLLSTSSLFGQGSEIKNINYIPSQNSFEALKSQSFLVPNTSESDKSFSYKKQKVTEESEKKDSNFSYPTLESIETKSFPVLGNQQGTLREEYITNPAVKSSLFDQKLLGNNSNPDDKEAIIHSKPVLDFTKPSSFNTGLFAPSQNSATIGNSTGSSLFGNSNLFATNSNSSLFGTNSLFSNTSQSSLFPNAPVSSTPPAPIKLPTGTSNHPFFVQSTEKIDSTAFIEEEGYASGADSGSEDQKNIIS